MTLLVKDVELDHLNSFDVRFDVRFVFVSSVSVPGVQRGPPQLSPETLGAAAPGERQRLTKCIRFKIENLKEQLLNC